MSELADLTLHEVSHGLAKGEFSAQELVRTQLERIASLDGDLNSFLTVLADGAIAEAANADLRRARRSRLGPPDGLPIAIKDNIEVEGVPITNGLARCDRIDPASADAFVIARLRAAGAMLIGKTNMDEGVLGGGTDNPHHGRTQNPWEKGHTAGGSSGGFGAEQAKCELVFPRTSGTAG